MMRWMWSTNKSMQRYTAHAASSGSLQETYLHFDAILRMAGEFRVDGSKSPQFLFVCLKNPMVFSHAPTSAWTLPYTVPPIDNTNLGAIFMEFILAGITYGTQKGSPAFS
jgi:hypothetical protein